MKIFNAMFSKVNGGLEQTFLNYTQSLSLHDNEVFQLVHPQAEILHLCPAQNLIKVHNFNQYDPFAILKLRALSKNYKPDCIITHSYRAAYLFKKTNTKIPKIAVCHVYGHYQFGADALIAVTESMRQTIIASGIPEDTVYTVPNMIPIPESIQYKEPKETSIPTIGVCARFAPIKGVDIFIQALALLKSRNISFKAQIAGDGPEREHYIKQIQDNHLQDNIELLGWIDDKKSFYESIDIFCLPSREEAFGLVVLESMMHSVPMILANHSGPQEIIGNSKAALFVPNEDPIKMADAIEILIKNPKLRKELSEKAFNRVHDYSNQAVAPMLDAVLEEICGKYK